MSFDTMGYDVLGEEMDGDDFAVVGAGVMPMVSRGGRAMLALPKKPKWRMNQVVPGVYGPQEGLQPLPLVPNLNNGVFTSVVQNIEFSQRPQKPFRGERLLVQVGRSALATSLVLTQGIFVGTQLQQAALGPQSIEFYTKDAFGVRLALQACSAALNITMQCFLQVALPVGESIAVNITLLGRSLG